MPQADLSYSAALDFNSAHALSTIEDVILGYDTAAGACKGRGFPVETTHHPHVLLRVSVLEKPHRTPEFMTGLNQKLFDALKPMIPVGATLGVELSFLSPFYITQQI